MQVNIQMVKKGTRKEYNGHGLLIYEGKFLNGNRQEGNFKKYY